MSKTVICIGTRADNGCGYIGGESGGTCPKCGGMLLSKEAIEIADKATKEFIKRTAEDEGKKQ